MKNNLTQHFTARFCRLGFLIILALLLVSCGDQEAVEPQPAAGATIAPLTITSPAFESGQPIPTRYTCQGEETSPPLEWSEPPPGTQSLALVMDDPDAPGGTWVHWVVFNLPPETTGLPEGAANGQASLPAGASSGANSWRRSGYGGPCPPSGEHRYFFRLYAIDTTLASDSLAKTELLEAIDGHILGQGETFGTYQQ